MLVLVEDDAFNWISLEIVKYQLAFEYMHIIDWLVIHNAGQSIGPMFADGGIIHRSSNWATGVLLLQSIYPNQYINWAGVRLPNHNCTRPLFMCVCLFVHLIHNSYLTFNWLNSSHSQFQFQH